MIEIKDIFEPNSKSLKDFGGLDGIRDISLLKSAIARPFQTFGGEYLYPTIFEKVAALEKALS